MTTRRGGRGCAFVRTALVLASLALAAGWAVGAPRERGHGHSSARETQRITAEDLGVEILALRPTAADRMLEMRFRVIDPEKSLRLLGKKAHALYLVDAKSGRALGVPSTKVGTLRQSTVRPVAGRTYFLMFGNPGVVHPGDDVILVVGETRLPGLIVQSKTGMSPPPQQTAEEESQEGAAGSPPGSGGSDTPSSRAQKPLP